MNALPRAIVAGAEQMVLALDAAQGRDETFPSRCGHRSPTLGWERTA